MEVGVRGLRNDTARVIDAVPAGGRVTLTLRGDSGHRSARCPHTLIAATAVVHGPPVVTQDDDFDEIARAHPGLRLTLV